MNQNIEHVVIVNVTSADGLTLAREFHNEGRRVIGIISEVDKDLDKDLSCLWQLLVGDIEVLAKAAHSLNNFCEVIYC